MKNAELENIKLAKTIEDYKNDREVLLQELKIKSSHMEALKKQHSKLFADNVLLQQDLGVAKAALILAIVLSTLFAFVSLRYHLGG